MFRLGFSGSDPVLPVPAGSPLGDALTAVAVYAHAAITGHGFTRADLWPPHRPVRPGPPPGARARLITSRAHGHRHARSPAGTLTMTTNAPFMMRDAPR